MIKKSVPLFVFFSLAASANLATAAPVSVPNAGFEDGATLNNWTVADADGSQSAWKLDATTFHQGKSALHLTKSNAAGYTALSSERIPVQAKTPYRLSAWLNLRQPSAAPVYYSINQFKMGPDGKEVGAGLLASAMLPVYGTNGHWEELVHALITSDAVTSIQIRLIFTGAPIDVLVDDVSLTSVSKEEYNPRYEKPTPETLLPQAEVEKIVAARPRAVAEVKKEGDRPRLFIDGKADVPLFYKGPGSWKFTSAQIGDFKRAGVNVYFIPYILGRGVYQNKPVGGWIGKDQVDFSDLDDLMWRVLRADPQGYIVFDISTDPYPAWGAENPDDVMTNAAGEKAIATGHVLRFGGPPPQPNDGSYAERYGYSYVSARLRRDTVNVLQQFDAHVRNSLPGKAVIGYYVNGGDDGQMFAWSDRLDQIVDYSPASLQAFHEWLKKRYPNNAALQQAWHRADVTFETAQVPTAKRRTASAFFLDPATEQDIIDYKRFHSEGTIDTKNIYAAALREAHQTPIVIGAYYSGPTIGIPSHRATGYLLQGGQYDLLTSVLAYGATRRPGGPGKAHQAWGSLLLHNTIGVAEEDFRSWKSIATAFDRDEQLIVRSQTAAESNALIRRDTGDMLALGHGAWWYDMDGGWFNDPSIMKAVAESVRAYRDDLPDTTLPRADVAVFVDEYSMDCINNPNTRPFRSALDRQIVQMKSSGVPFHTYLQSDLTNSGLPDYKLYVFLDAYHITANEWQAMQKLRRDGKTLCFLHAPGVASRDLLQAGNAAEAIAKVTGLAITADGEHDLSVAPSSGSRFGEGDWVGNTALKGPAFAVNDAQATAIGSYEQGGKTGVALRRFDNWTSVFYGGYGMDAFFFNALAREAKAWVAAPAGSAVYANQHFLTIHALSPGARTVKLLEPAKVTDLADGKSIAPKTGEIPLDMQRGETRWFRLEKPE